MFTTRGKLDYHSVWCVAWVDRSIGCFYRNLIPKAAYAQSPMYDAHVTVVSKYDSDAVKRGPLWGKYQGREIVVYYDGIVRPCADGLYYGLDCWSKDIGDLREELGLTRLLGGFQGDWPDANPTMDKYHITVANTKGNK